MKNTITVHARTALMALCCLGSLACTDDSPPATVGTQSDAAVTDVSPDASTTNDIEEISEVDAVSDAADVGTDAGTDVATDAVSDAETETSDTGDSSDGGPISDTSEDVADTDVPTADVPTDAPDGLDVDAQPPVDTIIEDVADLGAKPQPGDLLITEFMANPDGVADGDGEWFELVNLATETVDLAHCKLHDGGIDSFPLAFSWATLPMESGARWVLGPNDDPETNGGVQVDVMYSDFYLSNQSDEIRITCAGEVVEEIAYDGDWLIKPGVALTFDSAASQDTTTNDAPIHWCGAPTEYFIGNTGSPGLPNEACPIPDTEVDSCMLVSPSDVEIVEGEPLLFTGLIFDAGDTDVSAGLDEILLLVAQAGWGVAGSDLETWSWTDATGVASWNDSEMPGYDQYAVSLPAPELGSYSALFRFSMDDGATWTLCDLTGSEDGFSMADHGSFTTAEDPCVGAACGEAPGPECLDEMFTTYSGEGTCVAEGAEATCVYDAQSEDCALIGATCTPSGCTGGASLPLAGELVITEIMANPAAVSDPNGEWFELLNVTEKVLNLEGCSIESDNDTPSVITTDGALLVPPGGYILFVRNQDETVNGGLTGGYGYAGITLGNGDDSLSIHCVEGGLIDDVAWDDGLTFPDPAGASIQLDAGSLTDYANDLGEHWCASESPYGELGDLGTPGGPNQLCDPCLDVVCETPPEPSCDGDLAMTSETDGVCDAGLCLYTENEPTDCALTGETCVNGACMTPCAYFCELTETYCVGGLAVDFGESSCEEACLQWPVGSPSDDAVDTTWCRIGYLASGDDVIPATACAAASIDGGEICVNPPTTCELYCELAPQACQNDQEIVFGESDCPTVCASWDEGDSDDMLSDTAWCRLNHLELASEAPGFHCAAATPDGGETCVDHCVDVVCAAPALPSCDDAVATSYPEPFCDEGECLAPEVTQDCAVTGELCEDGACVAPPTLCSSYCDLVASTCFESDAIDFGEAGCVTTCEGWPAGDDDDVANGTTWCRINQLESETLGSSDSCAYAGPDGGGVCITTVVGLVINEFDYDQVSVDSAEFVEIYNPTASAALLGDYTLSTLNGATGEVHAEFQLGLAGAELAGGAYLVVGVQALIDIVPPGVLTLPAEVDFVQNAGNGGDAIGLFHNDGVTVDSVSYGGAIADWTEGALGTQEDPGPGGLSRCPNGVDSDSNETDFSWVESLSPGLPNVCPVDSP